MDFYAECGKFKTATFLLENGMKIFKLISMEIKSTRICFGVLRKGTWKVQKFLHK